MKNYIFAFLFLLFGSLPAYAHNIAVANTVLQDYNAGANTAGVKFDVTWEHPFSGTDANSAAFYDRAWIFVKYWVVGTDNENTGWHHATLTSGGTVTPMSDGKGAFVSIGANQVVKWNLSADGVGGGSTVKVEVCATEVVYIPQGQYVYDAAGVGTDSFNNFGAGFQTIVSAASHIPTGAAIGWPNGYSAFYIAKYEVSQGQYADFLNMLSAETAASLFLSQTINGQTITYTAGNSYGSRYAAGSPDRGNNYMSWDDCKAYAAWCAMRLDRLEAAE